MTLQSRFKVMRHLMPFLNKPFEQLVLTTVSAGCRSQLPRQNTEILRSMAEPWLRFTPVPYWDPGARRSCLAALQWG